jgi:dienelactone hydrolase
MKLLISVVAAGLLLAACTTQMAETPGPTRPAPTETQAPTETAVEPTAEPTTEPPAETPFAGADETPLVEARPVEEVVFGTEEEMKIAALYYPPTSGPAPGVLLLHQRGASKEAWEPLATRLRAARPDLALMAIDFPGHGGSDGPFSEDAALAAARSALAVFRGYEDVDSERVVIIGASIGADAAVDECYDGCIGMIAVSPGGWLGIPYLDALAELHIENDRPLLCVASENDAPSPETCLAGQEEGLYDYQVHIYEGSTHGNQLFYEEDLMPPPDIGDLVIIWLDSVLPPRRLSDD